MQSLPPEAQEWEVCSDSVAGYIWDDLFVIWVNLLYVRNLPKKS